MQVKLQRALALHQRGHLTQAQCLYEEVLAVQPQNSDALHLLGVVAAQTHNPTRALELMERAIELAAGNDVIHFNRGTVLQELQRWEDSIASYDRAIAIRRDYADAYFRRGVVQSELGRLEAALDSYDRAIAAKPDSIEAHFHRALLLQRLKRLEAALTAYERVLAINPDLAEAYCNHGMLLQQLNRLDGALASCDRAIALKPDLAEAHCNRGRVLQECGKREAALASYERAIALNPSLAGAHANLGDLLKELDQLHEALASCNRAIALDPTLAEAHSNRGTALQELGEREAALTCYDQAIALKPDCARAYCNRGTALQGLQRLDEALVSYDCAIAIDANFAWAHFNRAMALLLAGDFENGWRGYEWRWRVAGSRLRTLRHQFDAPLWLGEESVAGKTLLLVSEQGFGDTVQFCRYAELVADLGARVVLEVPRPLSAVLASLRGVAQVVVQGEPLPSFDYYCPLMSLPLALKTTLSTVPAQIQYLHNSVERLRHWQERLGRRSRRRVGLVWSGGLRPDQPEHWSVNRRRNIPLTKLSALNVPGIEFYSLQKGQAAETELAELTARHWDGPQPVNLANELRDFTDTAALIEQLDLIISVDTATAHLAGALGKPVWILNRFDTCWRWLLHRTDSPWYPTVRLYRQQQPGDWDDVLRRVRSDLERLPPCEQ